MDFCDSFFEEQIQRMRMKKTGGSGQKDRI